MVWILIHQHFLLFSTMTTPGCLKRNFFNDCSCTQFHFKAIFLVSSMITLILTLIAYRDESMRDAIRVAFGSNLSSALPSSIISTPAQLVRANVENGKSIDFRSATPFKIDISKPAEVVRANVEGGKNSNSSSTVPFRLYHDILTPNEPTNMGVEVGKNPLSSHEEILRNYEKKFQVETVDCAKIFNGVNSEVKKGRYMAAKMRKDNISLSEEFYISETTHCQSFIKKRGYLNSYLTNEEREFPIAFSILSYTDIEMFERLLRAIYRPQNFYCLHVDAKSSDTYLKAVTRISRCLPNVFLASHLMSVLWGKFSVLEPEMICMKDLWARSKKWKYFINLTGQEFPLKTNAELVDILTAYDGANDISSTVNRTIPYRWLNEPPPPGIRPAKGSVHIAVNRKFVDYVLHNETAQELLAWVKRTLIPDETFFASLNHNFHLGIPGTYKGLARNDTERRPFLARFKIWEGADAKCARNWKRNICILSTGDLPRLKDTPHMFANKFNLQDDRIAIGCLEEKHFNDTRDGYFGMKSFNSTFYKNLDFVKNKIPVWTKEDKNL